MARRNLPKSPDEHQVQPLSELEAKVALHLRKYDLFKKLEQQSESVKSLVQLFCLPVILDHQPKNSEDLLYQHARRTKKSLASFPKRLHKLAADVQVFLSLYDVRSDNRISLEHFRLPLTLRELAVLAVGHVDCVLSVSATDVQVWKMGLNESVQALVKFVKDKADSQHYEKLAEMLTTTAQALGITNDAGITKSYDAGFLKMRVFRHRER